VPRGAAAARARGGRAHPQPAGTRGGRLPLAWRGRL